MVFGGRFFSCGCSFVFVGRLYYLQDGAWCYGVAKVFLGVITFLYDFLKK